MLYYVIWNELPLAFGNFVWVPKCLSLSLPQNGLVLLLLAFEQWRWITMLRGSNYHSARSLDLKSIPLYVYGLPKDAKWMLKRQKYGSGDGQSESTHLFTTFLYPWSWVDTILSFPCLCSVPRRLQPLLKLSSLLIPSWHHSAQIWIHYRNAEC